MTGCALKMNDSIAEDQEEDSALCVLVCGERTFKTNKQHLMRNSVYFSAMITWHNCEGSSRDYIEIHDVEPQILDAILNFIESSQIPQLQGNEEELLATLHTSHMFMLKSLFNGCCLQLPSILHKNNLPEMLKLRVLFESDEFNKELFSFLAVHFFDLRETLTQCLDLNEVKLLLPYISFINPSVSSCDTLSFIMNWIKENIQTRQDHLIELISWADMKNLSDEELNSFLCNEYIFKYSRLARNTLIEKASIDQVHIIFKTFNELEIYNVFSKSFIEKLKISYSYTLLNPFYFQNSFYSVAFKRKYKEFSTSLSIFHQDRENNIQIINEIGSVKGKLHLCAVGDFIYIISCQGKNWNQSPYKVKILNFNFLTKRFRIISKKYVSHEITDIASSHFFIFMLSKPQPSGFESIVCFDVNSYEWHEIPIPPTTSPCSGEFASCCLDQLHVFRFHAIGLEQSQDEGEQHDQYMVEICSLNFDVRTWKIKRIGNFEYEMTGFIHFQNRNIKCVPFLYLALNSGKVLQFNIRTFESEEIQTWNPHENPRFFNAFCK